MKLLIFLSSLLFVANTTASTLLINNHKSPTSCETLEKEKSNLLHAFIENKDPEIIAINSISVSEVDEEVVIPFDTKKYLPIDFNPLKGKGDLDWSKIAISEIDEEVVIPFGAKKYLPIDFNPLKGKDDLDWSKTVIYEVEEEVFIPFNTKIYIPVNFNPLKGKNDLDWSTIIIYEVEEEVVLGFNTKDYLPKDFNAQKSVNETLNYNSKNFSSLLKN